MAMTDVFPVDEALLASAGDRLRARPDLRFVLGEAGGGKSSVCRHAAAGHAGIILVDMDARIYGDWGDRWDRRRHPAATAWLGAADPLGWQLAMTPPAYLAFQSALAAEALDLLADELADAPADGSTRLVDGGFGSVATLACAVPAAWIACVAAPATAPGDPRGGVWTTDPDRRAFVEVVAAVAGIDEPVARFLALDEALTAAMRAEAVAAGVALVQRLPGETIDATASRVMRCLGIGDPAAS